MPPKKRQAQTKPRVQEESVPTTRAKRKREDEEIKTEEDVKKVISFSHGYNPASKGALETAIRHKKTGMVKLFLAKKTIDPTEMSSTLTVGLASGDEEILTSLIEYCTPVPETFLEEVISKWISGTSSAAEILQLLLKKKSIDEEKNNRGNNLKNILNKAFAVSCSSSLRVRLCPLSYGLLTKAPSELLDALINCGADVNHQYQTISEDCNNSSAHGKVYDVQNGGVVHHFPLPWEKGASPLAKSISAVIPDANPNQIDFVRLTTPQFAVEADADLSLSNNAGFVARSRGDYFLQDPKDDEKGPPFCRTLVEVHASEENDALYRTVFYFPPTTTLREYYRLLWDHLKLSGSVTFSDNSARDGTSRDEQLFDIFRNNVTVQQRMFYTEDKKDKKKVTREDWVTREAETFTGPFIDKPHSFEQRLYGRVKIFSSDTGKLSFKPLKAVIYDADGRKSRNRSEGFVSHAFGGTVNVFLSVLENYSVNGKPQQTEQEITEAVLYLLRRGARCDMEVDGRTALDLVVAKYSEDLAEVLLSSLA